MERKKISHSFTMRGSLRVPHSIPTSLFFKFVWDQKSQRTTVSSQEHFLGTAPQRSGGTGVVGRMTRGRFFVKGALSLQLRSLSAFAWTNLRLFRSSRSKLHTQSCAEAAHDRYIPKQLVGEYRRCLSTEVGIHVRYKRCRPTARSFVGRGGEFDFKQNQRGMRNNSVYQQQAPGGCGLSACAMMNRKELDVSLCFV
jgi:hypothetical protein